MLTDQRHLFDLVVEPGELAADDDRGATRALRAEATRVGPVTYLEGEELLDRAAARAALGLDPARPAALVTLGAGNIDDADSTLRRVLDRLGREPDLQVLVTRSMIAEQQTALPDNVRAVSVYPLARYLHAFDLAVAAAGYNSFHELGDLPGVTVTVPVAGEDHVACVGPVDAPARGEDAVVQRGVHAVGSPQEPEPAQRVPCGEQRRPAHVDPVAFRRARVAAQGQIALGEVDELEPLAYHLGTAVAPGQHQVREVVRAVVVVVVHLGHQVPTGAVEGRVQAVTEGPGPRRAEHLGGRQPRVGDVDGVDGGTVEHRGHLDPRLALGAHVGQGVVEVFRPPGGQQHRGAQGCGTPDTEVVEDGQQSAAAVGRGAHVAPSCDAQPFARVGVGQQLLDAVGDLLGGDAYHTRRGRQLGVGSHPSSTAAPSRPVRAARARVLRPRAPRRGCGPSGDRRQLLPAAAREVRPRGGPTRGRRTAVR